MNLIGHGIDLVNINRSEFNNYDFAKRYMTIQEYEYGLKNFKNNTYSLRRYMAKIWAIKEAIIKATNKLYLYSQINIISNKNSISICSIENINLIISISYQDKYLVASVISYNG